MIVIGLTGGVASGKSLVAGKFEELGAVLIDADAVAREVLVPGQPAFDDAVLAFGKGILTAEGEIDRKKLGSIVFGNDKRRKELNRITHPRIRERMMARLEELREAETRLRRAETRLRRSEQSTPDKGSAREGVVVLDIPLLIESGLKDKVDCVIVVYADEETRLRRLMERDGLGKEDARARINSQIPLEDKIKDADFVIDNNKGAAATLKETERLYGKLTALK